jgi:hypothetical protein
LMPLFLKAANKYRPTFPAPIIATLCIIAQNYNPPSLITSFKIAILYFLSWASLNILCIEEPLL